MKYFLFYLLIFSLISCGSYVEYNRTYCGDSSKYLLRYDFDMGALDGGGEWNVAILHNTDNAKRDCSNYSISNHLFNKIYWKGNDTVIVEENYIEFMRNKKSSFKNSIFKINNISVKVIQNDFLDTSFSRQDLYSEISPNKKYSLIVYRYLKHNSNNNNTIHISVIKPNETIPKYGNFYITKEDFNCFQDIRWNKNNELIIKVSEACTSRYDASFVSDKPKLNYKIKIIKIGEENKSYDNIKSNY